MNSNCYASLHLGEFVAMEWQMGLKELKKQSKKCLRICKIFCASQRKIYKIEGVVSLNYGTLIINYEIIKILSFFYL